MLTGIGLPRRELFSHDVVAIPKPYPDSQLFLERRGVPRFRLSRGAFQQLNLYTRDMYDLPRALFTHREVNWHGQQLGRIGLVAAAGLFVSNACATIAILQSDLCQQLYRQPELKRACKTRLEMHFKHWYVLLFNAIMDYCVDLELATLYCPTGDQVARHTQKTISVELFRRIYDMPAKRYRSIRVSLGGADYWQIPIAENTDRIVRLTAAQETEPAADERPVITIFHDIEEDVDTPVSAAECANHLARMLQIEGQFGVNATYDILGTLFDAKRRQIWASNGRHSIAFHSYDHNIRNDGQLTKCRNVDLRVRGYRPPQSRITSELSDYNLTYLNFEWLASSAASLGFSRCRLQNGLVKIPIHLDDFPLYRGTMRFEEWEGQVLSTLRVNRYVAIGLHDCYGDRWLPHYPDLLKKLGALGRFMTADDLSDGIFLGVRSAAFVPSVGGRRLPSTG